MPEPRNVCPLPDWLPPNLAEKLLVDDLIACPDMVRNSLGEIIILNGVVVTEKGQAIAFPSTNWTRLGVWIALATLVAMVGIFFLARWLR